MGAMSLANQVRYDPERQVYDVRDVLLVAYGTERAVKTAVKQAVMPSRRLKWSDRGNTGKGRVVGTSAECAALLRTTLRTTPRASLRVDGVINWFTEHARAGAAQPTLLPVVAHSENGLCNVYSTGTKI